LLQFARSDSRTDGFRALKGKLGFLTPNLMAPLRIDSYINQVTLHCLSKIEQGNAGSWFAFWRIFLQVPGTTMELLD
jgi:hypothetical protein